MRSLAAALMIATLTFACDRDPGGGADAAVVDAPVDQPIERTVYSSQESQYCSTAADDDPFYVCSSATDLVCVSTYSQLLPGPDAGPPRSLPIYLCRLACQPTTRCPGDEICCPGVRADGQVQHACVPESRCDALVRDR